MNTKYNYNVMYITVQVMDTINEEEKQFLKTLSRGRRVFERTVNKLTDNILPGKKSFIMKWSHSISYM